jgi:hypothetical protein
MSGEPDSFVLGHLRRLDRKMDDLRADTAEVKQRLTVLRSVLALARALGRDYKRVHEDVEALVAAGLLDRNDAGLRADYDAIQIAM